MVLIVFPYPSQMVPKLFKPVKLTKLFTEFFESEKSSGIILIGCTLFSLIATNSVFGDSYLHFWHLPVGTQSLEYWINDGLMTIFFLLVGLEIERELYIGELADVKNALLPIVAALGGMLLPAGIHLLLNRETPTQAGFGIPMATDIAFALGVLALLGNRVPVSLKIFLTALAIIDDLGAVLVIAIFYVTDFSLLHFGIAMGIFAALLVLNRLRVHNIWFYPIPGVVMWYFMLQSGVHATITGVLLAFAIPFGSGDEQSPSYGLQHVLHKPVAFLILPAFALANTGIHLAGDWYTSLSSINSMGIMAGLVAGKPIGILLFCALAVRLGICALPGDLNWKHVTGAGLLGGIGFTMSIFITVLAFRDPVLVQQSKIAVLAASIIAGLLGFVVIRMIKPMEIDPENELLR